MQLKIRLVIGAISIQSYGIVKNNIFQMLGLRNQLCEQPSLIVLQLVYSTILLNYYIQTFLLEIGNKNFHQSI